MRRSCWVVLLLFAACDSGEGPSLAGDAATGDADPADGAPGPDAGPDAEADARPVADGGVTDAALPPAGEVRLNEVGCTGRDWIEVINPGEAPVALAGWAVTDDPARPERAWPLGSGSLAPGALGVVLAAAEGEPGFAFGIACDETITLLRPEGTVADAARLAVPGWGTWGRLPDGTGEWAATTPTLGTANRPAEPVGGPLFEAGAVFEVALSLDDAAVAALADRPREKVPGRVVLTTAGGARHALDVGVRIKGRAGSARTLESKAAFKLDVNFQAKDQRLFGLKDLTLNNLVQDRSMVHEWTAYALARAMGLPAPRVGHAWVRVNGVDFGLYALVESYDDVFLARHFVSTQHLYEGLYGQDLFNWEVDALEVDEGDPEDREDLYALVALLDDPPGEVYAATRDAIDWDEVLGVMVWESFVGHWDGYAPSRNNWFMHTDAEGRLSLLPWGADQTFDFHLPLHGGVGRLLAHCFEAPACREAYDHRLAGLLAVLDGLDLERQVEALGVRLRPWVERDPRRPYDLGAFDEGVQGTVAFLRARRAGAGALVDCLFGPDPDPDGDGFACDADCAPEDPEIYPGARDLCGDGIDQDCSGRADDAEDCPDCEAVTVARRTFLVCTRGRTWAASMAHCLAQGALPLVIDDAAENEAAAAAGRSVWEREYWFGLSDRDEEGRFVWWDGTEPGFVAWDGGEPNDAGGGEDCAHFWGFAPIWNDLPCEAELGVICELP